MRALKVALSASIREHKKNPAPFRARGWLLVAHPSYKLNQQRFFRGAGETMPVSTFLDSPYGEMVYKDSNSPKTFSGGVENP